EAEHAVVHHLRKLAPRFHAFDHDGFELFEPGRVGCCPLLCDRGAAREKKCGECEPPKRAGFPSLHADHRALRQYGIPCHGRSPGLGVNAGLRPHVRALDLIRFPWKLNEVRETTMTGIDRRTWLQASATAFAAALLGAQSGWAQGYPQRPVRIIVPYAPGGGT